MRSIAELFEALAVAESDARTAEYTDDVSAWMPYGALWCAWDRVRQAKADLAEGLAAERLRTPASLRAECDSATGGE